MSLVTGFDSAAHRVDLNRSTATCDSISLSVMTADDMERLSVVQVRTLLGKEPDRRPCQPVVKRDEEMPTFWDTRMGNFDVKGFDPLPCSTCCVVGGHASGGQAGAAGVRLNKRCSGHFGSVSMPVVDKSSGFRLPFYNPLLFADLVQLLQAQCHFCGRFRASLWELTRYEEALTLLDSGLAGDAYQLLEVFPQKQGADATAKRLREAGEKSIHDMSAIRAWARSRKARVEQANILHNNAILDIRHEIVAAALRDLKMAAETCTCCGGMSPRLTVKNAQIYVKYLKGTIEKNVAMGKLSQEDIEDIELEKHLFGRQQMRLSTVDALEKMQKLCEFHPELIARLFPNVGSATVDVPARFALLPTKLFSVFFINQVLVPPLPVRTSSGIQVIGQEIAPDDRTRSLNEILRYSKMIEDYYNSYRHNATEQQRKDNELNILSLQLKVNEAYTSVLESFAKKEGMFRMNMMGKRVNQACRSVISPDVSLEANQVLLPRPFARSLSYPEILSFYSSERAELIKRCILNGPKKYPGATHVVITSPHGDEDRRELKEREKMSRQDIMETAFSKARTGSTVTVYRHILDGDNVIFNRQPTLHKPSMMGYRTRVLSGLKTIRFHYVNGKSFNADFDGDEMNVHIPQSVACRAELETVMDANLNFLVPTSGRPIRGLIQDHVAAGVLLTTRDRFFAYEEFVQLCCVGLLPYLRPHRDDMAAMIPIPAILFPKPLWTGKQLASVLVRCATDIFQGSPGVSLTGIAAVPNTMWQPPRKPSSNAPAGSGVRKGDLLGEDRIVIHKSELLQGILDKNQLGPANLSLFHIIHDIYGPHRVGMLFSAIGRVLTKFLQTVGFTMGMDDMIIVNGAERRKQLQQVDMCAVGETSEGAAVSQINKKASEIVSSFIPRQMLLLFPLNFLLLMTSSGAKGSNVNATQMSLVLGQQMFDGLRVKPMCSGKTLPGFFSGEERARSRGFAMGRFASGIRPHEYTIHAMAGRDGLIDTAVKTSRSGHLQRCLIKGLESLTVHWDGTVRDSNGAVIQFKYGGDGLDPCKSSTLTAWDMVNRNLQHFQKKMRLSQEEIDGGADLPDLPAHLKASLDSSRISSHTLPSIVAKYLEKNDTRTAVQKIRERQADEIGYFKDQIHIITAERLMRSKCDGGDPVGLLAAQAAGEPSTQMTLNTFHQAGATVSHVTEGIPRLRELLIFASVSNPAVVVPYKNASNSELGAIKQMVDVVTPIPLKEAVAPTPDRIRWNFSRGATNATLTLCVAFSCHKLNEIAEKMRMSHNAHVECFYQTIKKFAEQLDRAISGQRKKEPMAESADQALDLREPVDDPALLLEETQEDVEEPTDQFERPEADNRRVFRTDLSPVTKASYPDFGVPEENEDRDDEEEAGDYIPEEQEDTAQQKIPSQKANCVLQYREFQPIVIERRTSFVRVTGEPARPLKGQDSSDYQAVLSDLFVVKTKITLPPDTVTVVSDAITTTFNEVNFVTNAYPQVERALSVPDSQGPEKGQVIFQGTSVRLKSILKVVSEFAEEAPCLQWTSATSTNIHDVIDTFGVEAGNLALQQELSRLFSRHSVDSRHLSLIADTATQRGYWEDYNFNGVIQRSASPLFQMTFASSKRFLHTALARSVSDQLDSISASIMVGETPKVGTATSQVSMKASVIENVVERMPALPAPML